jgi:hypothetical protein
MIKIRNKSENGYPPTPCKPQAQLGDKTITNNKKQTRMKKKNYVPPGIEIHRVIMETSIADTVMYFKGISPWTEGGTIGDGANDNLGNAEGGDIYVTWN